MLPELEQIIEKISSLPGIGRKSAMRIAFHFLRQSPAEIDEFKNTLLKFTANVEHCLECGALKSRQSQCQMCSPKRDASVICVVEQPYDIFAIESTAEYYGLYHVTMGALSPLDGISPDDLRLASIPARIEKLGAVQEVILATNPSVEGNTTANYIHSLLSKLPALKITRIASGLALGTQLEFADSRVISQSLRGRTVLNL